MQEDGGMRCNVIAEAETPRRHEAGGPGGEAEEARDAQQLLIAATRT